MEATLDPLESTLLMGRSVLIVDPDLTDGYAVASQLAALAFRVTISRSFQEAKALLGGGHFALLITALRLREYNGLHLVLRARSIHHRLAAIVTHATDDPVLIAEADRLSATYLKMPTPSSEFIAAVTRTITRDLDTSEPPLRPPFERRHMDRRQANTALAIASERRRVDRRIGLSGWSALSTPTLAN
jgi:DNA-binding NtrC family response regulator